MRASKSWAFLFTAIIAFAIAPLIATPECAYADDRTEVSLVWVTPNAGVKAPAYGESVADSSTTILNHGGIEAHDASDNIIPVGITLESAYMGSSRWQQKVDGVWVDVYDGFFTSGTWRYVIDVEINNEAYTKDYRLGTGTVFHMGGSGLAFNEFEFQNAEEPSGCSWGYAYSNECTITGLVFNDLDSFDIPSNEVGTAIESYSVASQAWGGTEPYVFFKDSGPDWIDVSADGTVSGTPTDESANEDLVIGVRDGLGQEAYITVAVGDSIKSDGKTLIGLVTGTSNLDTVAVLGNSTDIEAVSLTVTNPPGSIVNFRRVGWQKQVSGEWKWADDESYSTFTGGKWRFVLDAVVLPGYATDYKFMPSVALEIDGNAYEAILVDNDATWWDGGKACIASFYSPEITLGSEIPLNTATIDGVTEPVAGMTWTLSGITTSTEHVKINFDETTWRYEYGGVWYVVDEGTKFFDGMTYGISICLEPEEGYVIEGPFTGHVNGHTLTAAYPDADGRVYLLAPMDMAQTTDALYMVTAGALNVRDAASKDSNRVGGLHVGDVVQAKAISHGWALVELDDGTQGWVDTNYLALTYSKETAFADGPVYYTVAAGAMNVRNDASMSATRIGGVTQGTQVLATGARVNSNEETWLVVDIVQDGTHKLGFILFSKRGSLYDYYYYFTASETAPVEEPGVEDVSIPGIDVGVLPTVSFAPDYRSAKPIANGNTVELGEDALVEGEDGLISATIWPDDGDNFETLAASGVTLPADFDYTVIEVALNADGSATIIMEPKDVSYSCVAGDGTTIVEGSGDTATFTFKRSANDKSTFSHFTGVMVDGVLVDASNYTSVSGSVVVTLSSEYVGSLSVGNHTLTAMFDDSNDADASFTVQSKSEGTTDAGDSNTASGSTGNASTTGASTAPKTGDNPLALVLAIACVASGVVCVVALRALRRKY